MAESKIITGCRHIRGSNFSRIVRGESYLGERVLCRGAISFPKFDLRDGTFQGALSVCCQQTDKDEVMLLDVKPFSAYTFQFRESLKSLKDKWDVTDYYFNERDYEDSIKLIKDFIKLRKNGIRNIVYPEFSPVSFSSEFDAYSTMVKRMSRDEFRYSALSPFHVAKTLWDNTKPFKDAPTILQAVCVNVAGLDNDTHYYLRNEEERDN